MKKIEFKWLLCLFYTFDLEWIQNKFVKIGHFFNKNNIVFNQMEHFKSNI